MIKITIVMIDDDNNDGCDDDGNDLDANSIFGYKFDTIQG